MTKEQTIYLKEWAILFMIIICNVTNVFIDIALRKMLNA